MKRHPIIKRQIIASPRGVSQMYPGYKWRTNPADKLTMCKIGDVKPDCPGFDPRTRGWYLGTASSSKSIVVILDVSSSMGDHNRLENAIYATRTVINNLTPKDYVGIVMFNAEAFMCRRHADVLLQATPANRKLLIDCIENMTPFGSTNFEAAFNETFNLFEKSMNSDLVSSTCDNVILFLTDGTITKGANPLELIRKRNAEIKAKIFSFSLGSIADTVIPKKIACENRGLWNVIQDKRIQDLTSHMSSYYEYLSARYEDRAATWIEPFNDVTGLGEVVTVSLPCSTPTGKFLGVATAAMQSGPFLKSPDYWSRTTNFTCPTDIPDKDIQRLRIEEGKTCNYCGYCIDEDSTIVLAAGGSSIVVFILLCVAIVVSVYGCRKLYIRRKWKIRKNMMNSRLHHSHSWTDYTTSKRKLEKVRLPARIEGEEIELNDSYSSFKNTV